MSRNHAKLNARQWARVRRQALRRAGFRSELSGKVGRLECHHLVRLKDDGDPYDLANLVVMTRDEHIRHHEKDQIAPDVAAWRDYVKELVEEG